MHKITHLTRFGEVYMFNPAIIQDPQDKTNFLVFGRATRGSNPRYTDFCNKNKPHIPISSSTIQGAVTYFGMAKKGQTLLSALVKYKTNSNFDQITTPIVVNPFITTKHIVNMENPGIEDPRLFQFKNHIWCIVSFRGKDVPSVNHFNTSVLQHQMMLFPVDDPSNIIVLNYPQRNLPIDKNWQPFEYKHSLYLVYTMTPHHILKIDMDTGLCTGMYSTPFPKGTSITGKMGGGAPPQRITWKNESVYLGVAHTRQDFFWKRTRKTFWYVFKGSPPFNIIYVSPVFDILHPNIDIEYVTGLVVSGNEAIISFGINDCFCGFKKIPLSKVLQTLIKV